MRASSEKACWPDLSAGRDAGGRSPDLDELGPRLRPDFLRPIRAVDVALHLTSSTTYGVRVEHFARLGANYPERQTGCAEAHPVVFPRSAPQWEPSNPRRSSTLAWMAAPQRILCIYFPPGVIPPSLQVGNLTPLWGICGEKPEASGIHPAGLVTDRPKPDPRLVSGEGLGGGVLTTPPAQHTLPERIADDRPW